MEFVIGAIIIIALGVLAYLFFTLRRDCIDDIDNLYGLVGRLSKQLLDDDESDEKISDRITEISGGLEASSARIDEIDDKLTKRLRELEMLFKDYNIDEQIDDEQKLGKAFKEGLLNVLNFGLDKGKKGE